MIDHHIVNESHHSHHSGDGSSAAATSFRAVKATGATTEKSFGLCHKAFAKVVGDQKKASEVAVKEACKPGNGMSADAIAKCLREQLMNERDGLMGKLVDMKSNSACKLFLSSTEKTSGVSSQLILFAIAAADRRTRISTFI